MTVIILFKQTTTEDRDELIKSDWRRILLCHSNHIHFRIYFLGDLYQFNGKERMNPPGRDGVAINIIIRFIVLLLRM